MAEIAGLMVRLEATTALLRNELKRAEVATSQTASRIERDAFRAEDALGAIGSTLKGSLAGLAAGLGVDAFAGAISASLSYATNLKNVAAQSGLTTQALQQMDGAFAQLGLGADGFQNALEEMLPNLGEALTGSGGAAQSFQKLGVQLRDASGNVRSTDQILLSMADALRDVQSPAERAGIAAAVFGEEAGPAMAQALSQGSAQIRALMGDVRTLSDEMIERAAQIDREWNSMSRTVGTVLKSALLSFLADARQLGTDVSAITGGVKDRITAPAEAGDKTIAQIQAQIVDLERDLQIAIDKKAEFAKSPYFQADGPDPYIASTRTLIAELKDLLKTKQDLADQDAALKGMGGNIPSNFGNSQGSLDQPFIQTDSGGKALTTPNTARFGAASEEDWKALQARLDAEAKKTEATAEQRAKAIAKVVAALKLESENLGRTADDQELYNKLAEAGVERGDVAGQLIEREVRAMQDRQRMADFWTQTQEADKAALDEKRSILEAIRTPSQKYNEEMDRLNRLLNAGTLSWSEWSGAATLAWQELEKGNKALEKLSPEMEYLQKTGERAFDRIGAGITDAFVSGEGAAVSFKNTALAVISELLQSFIELAAVNPLKNLLFGTASATLGSVGGNLAVSLAGNSAAVDGGTFGGVGNGPNMRAAGGPVVAGQSYLVGERQAEIFTPDVNGRILPKLPGLATTASAGKSGDSYSVVQHLNFATGVQSTVRAEIMNMLPTISNTARAGILESQARRGRSL